MEHHNNALMNPKVELTKQDMSKENISIYSVAIIYENGTLIFSILLLLTKSLISNSFNFQGAGGISCNLSRNCPLQNNCHFHLVSDSIFADVFWFNLDSNCWCSFSVVDHASCPCAAVFASQVLQRCSSPGLGCC